MRRHSAMALVDTVLFIAFLALESPGASTGFAIHEWVGVAFIPLAAIHLVLSWGWVPGVVRRIRRGADARAKLNAFLNVVLLITMLVATVTGFVISDYVSVPWHLPTSDDPRWRQVHNMTASFLFAFAGAHVALNWTWIRAAARRYFGAIIPGRSSVRER